MKLSVQFARFALVGAIAMLADGAIFFFFARHLSVDYRIAAFFSWTSGFMVNFFLCNFFVFEQQNALWRAAFRHYLASLASFAFQMAGMLVLINYLEVKNWVLARIAVAGLVFIINFFVIRRFVFSNRQI